MSVLAPSTSFSNATCVPSYSWALNACGQDPCLVSAHLQSLCSSGSGYIVPALPPDTHYIGPQKPNPCQCNSVVYSLLSACASCQERGFTALVLLLVGLGISDCEVCRWSEWNSNCLEVYDSSFPMAIPNETSIPAWAFVSPSENHDIFNVTLAKILAAQGLPDVYPWNSTVSPGTITINHTANGASTSAPSNTQSSLPSTQYSPSSSPTSQPNQTALRGNRIAWGVIGAISGLLLILGVMYFVIRRKRRHVEDTLYKTLSPFSGASPRHNGQPYTPNSSQNHIRNLSATTTTPLMCSREDSAHTEDRLEYFLPPLTTSISRLSLPSMLDPIDSAVTYSPAAESSNMYTSWDHSADHNTSR